jgi:hypothetical protein
MGMQPSIANLAEEANCDQRNGWSLSPANRWYPIGRERLVPYRPRTGGPRCRERVVYYRPRDDSVRTAAETVPSMPARRAYSCLKSALS